MFSWGEVAYFSGFSQTPLWEGVSWGRFLASVVLVAFPLLLDTSRGRVAQNTGNAQHVHYFLAPVQEKLLQRQRIFNMSALQDDLGRAEVPWSRRGIEHDGRMEDFSMYTNKQFCREHGPWDDGSYSRAGRNWAIAGKRGFVTIHIQGAARPEPAFFRNRNRNCGFPFKLFRNAEEAVSPGQPLEPNFESGTTSSGGHLQPITLKPVSRIFCVFAQWSLLRPLFF